MSEPTTHSTERDSTIKPQDIVFMLLRHRTLIAVSTCVFIFFGLVFCYFRSFTYQADALLIMDAQQSNSLLSVVMNGSAQSSPLMENVQNLIVSEKSLLVSRNLLEPVIGQLHLDVLLMPHYFPLIGKRIAMKYDTTNYSDAIAPPKFGTHHYSWGGVTAELSKFEVSENLKHGSFLLTYLGNQRYRVDSSDHKFTASAKVGEQIVFQPNAYTRLELVVGRIVANPDTQFTLQQQPMETALKNLRANLIIADAGNGRAFYGSSGLLSISFKDENPEKAARILNAVSEQAVLKSVAQGIRQTDQALYFLHNRLPQAQRALHAAEEALGHYEETTGNLSLTEQSGFILQSIEQLQTQMAQTRLQKIQLAHQYTENSLPMVQLDEQLLDAQHQLQQFLSKLKELPGATEAFVNLTQEVTIKNDIYVNLLKNIEQYELLKAAAIGSVRVIDPAVKPYAPVTPPSTNVLTLMATVGFAVGIAISLLKHLAHRGVTNPRLIESMLGLPIIAMIYENYDQKQQQRRLKKGILDHLKLQQELDPESLSTESFRSLRTQLLLKPKEPSGKGKIILITGITQEVGKSFVSANLAGVFAENKSKVLLIDADTRRGDLEHYFNVSAKPGLTELITGEASLEAVTHSTSLGVSFIPHGSSLSQQTALFMRPEFEQLMEKLAQIYDFIVIDTPPILAVPDAMVIGKIASLRLLVLAYEEHAEEEIFQALTEFKRVDQTIEAAIMNRIPEKRIDQNYRYGYQHYYRYNYRAKKS